MHPDVDLVLQLQSLDQRITALEKEVAMLPRHIALIEKTLESHVRKLEADKAALAANLRDRKKLEGDNQLHDQKVSKLRDQMNSAKTNEQYRAFQNEIDYAQKEIRAAEDRIIDLMSQSEPLESAVRTAETALKQEQKVVEAEKARARERTAADQAELAKIGAEREQILAGLAKPVSAAYVRIRKKWNGAVVSEVVEGRCTACQIMLRPQAFQDLRKASDLMFCESCGRFLYYKPPAALVDMTTMA